MLHRNALVQMFSYNTDVTNTKGSFNQAVDFSETAPDCAANSLKAQLHMDVFFCCYGKSSAELVSKLLFSHFFSFFFLLLYPLSPLL